MKDLKTVYCLYCPSAELYSGSKTSLGSFWWLFMTQRCFSGGASLITVPYKKNFMGKIKLSWAFWARVISQCRRPWLPGQRAVRETASLRQRRWMPSITRGAGWPEREFILTNFPFAEKLHWELIRESFSFTAARVWDSFPHFGATDVVCPCVW